MIREALDYLIRVIGDQPYLQKVNDDGLHIVKADLLLGHAIKELDDRLKAVEEKLGLDK